jgi:hypothetical protein
MTPSSVTPNSVPPFGNLRGPAPTRYDLREVATSMSRRRFGLRSRAVLIATLLGCLASAARSEAQFVGTQGTQFVYQGSGIAFYGSTFYPSEIGGTSAWHSSSFPSYIDQVIALEQQGGQNVMRPTDFFFKNRPGQDPYDPVVWANMDYLVSTCAANGLFVIMDISAYRWLLESDGRDSTDANNWYEFIDFVAARYANEPAVAFYYIMGEPTVPTDEPSAEALTAFFDNVTTRLRGDDPNHLICAGGFNHMLDHPELNWWQRIFSLPNNDIGGYKTYSQHDLDYMSTVTSYTTSIGKPAFEAEFGMPQYMGDCEWSGQTYNGIATSRADFFSNVYMEGLNGGTAAFVFWNLGNQSGDTSYNVSPTVSPCTWAVLLRWPPPRFGWPLSVRGSLQGARR